MHYFFLFFIGFLSLIASSLQANPTLQLTTSQLTPQSELILVFDKSMISNEDVGKTLPNTLLLSTPQWDGNIHWKSPNIAQFIPQKAPLIGKNYTFSLQKGLRYQDGSPLGNLQGATHVESERFGIGAMSTYNIHLNKNLSPRISISFNDALIVTKELEKFIFFESSDHKQRIPAHFARAYKKEISSPYYRGKTWKTRFIEYKTGKPLVSDDPNIPLSNVMWVTPRFPLTPAIQWGIKILPGIPNATQTAHTKRLYWRDIGLSPPFKVHSIQPRVVVNQPNSLDIHFSLPLEKGLTKEQLAEYIKISPTPQDLALTASGSTISVSGDFSQKRQWAVAIKRELLSQNGLFLPKDYTFYFTFPHLKPSIALPSFQNTQFSAGKRSYEIQTINIKQLHIRAKLVERKDLLRMIEGYDYYVGRGVNNQKIFPKAPLPYPLITGKTILTKNIDIKSNINTSHLTTLQWDELIPSLKGKTGILFLSVEGIAKDSMKGKYLAQSLVQLTDIGLMWKKNAKNLFVYAFSCKTGHPLENLKLSLYDKDAQLIQQSLTNSSGIFSTANLTQDIAFIQANSSNDQFAMHFDNTLSSFPLWDFNIDIGYYFNAYSHYNKIYLFTDRNLYRPQETLHLKGIARNLQGDTISYTEAKEISIDIFDSKNNLIFNKKLALSPEQTFDLSFTLPNKTLGQFRAHCSLIIPKNNQHPDDKERLSAETDHYFRVAEFRRNAFEVHSQIAPPATHASSINLEVKAHYYQGQSITNGTLKWFATTRQVGFYPEKHPDYLFGDHREGDPYYWQHYYGYSWGDYPHLFRESRHGKLPLKPGEPTQLTLPINHPEFPVPLSVHISSEVIDSRAQTIRSTSSTFIHPAQYYLGVKRIDKLLEVNAPIDIPIMAVASNGEAVPLVNPIELTIEREFFEKTKLVSSDGKVSVQNTKKKETLSTQTLSFKEGENTTSFTFTPEHTGRHIFTLRSKDAQSREVATSFSEYIYGKDQDAWSMRDGNNISLIPEKTSYKVGEVAKILLMTPVEGKVLVTVERDHVLRYFFTNLTKKQPVIEVPTQKGDDPNIFVSVFLLRSMEKSPHQVKTPTIQLGYISLNVNDPSKKLTLALHLPKEAQLPGQKTHIEGTVFKEGKPLANAEVTLYGEDEGVLAVMGYDAPDPMTFFLSKLELALQTGSSLDHFMEEGPPFYSFNNKGFLIGGGVELASKRSLSGHRALHLRKNFNPCAFWLPHLKTDHQGRFSATITNPDNLTRYRVIALALSGKENFGVQTGFYTVNKPLMLEPMPPRYASQGDAITTRVLVMNNTKEQGTWDISLHPEDTITHIDPSSKKQTITLAPGSSQVLSFDIALKDIGTAKWIWEAVSSEHTDKNNQDSMESSFKVTFPAPLLTQTLMGKVPASNDSPLLDGFDRELIEGKNGTLSLVFSNALIAYAKSSLDYLLHYPYGCAEQTTSTMLPWIVLHNLQKKNLSLSNKTPQECKQAIDTAIQRLFSMQTHSGGLAYWPSGKEPTAWSSSYACFGIALAKKEGFNVPEASFSKLLQWTQNDVKSQLEEKNPSPWTLEICARSLYALSLAKQHNLPLAHRLLDKKESLSSNALLFLALTFNQAGENALAKTLFNESKAHKKEDSSPLWLGNTIHNALTLYAQSIITPQDTDFIKKIQLLLSTRNHAGVWENTWQNAWGLLALGELSKLQSLSHTTISLKHNGKVERFSLNQKNPLLQKEFSLKEARNYTIAFSNPCYKTATLSAKPNNPQHNATSQEGYSIIRHYFKVLGDGSLVPAQELKLGDLIEVRLEVLVPENQRYFVIEDRLPSLFEGVEEDFSSQSSSQGGQHPKGLSKELASMPFLFTNEREMRSDRVSFFVTSWAESNRPHQVRYLARVTQSGKAIAPSAKVESMYLPQKRGTSQTQTFIVKPSSP